MRLSEAFNGPTVETRENPGECAHVHTMVVCVDCGRPLSEHEELDVTDTGRSDIESISQPDVKNVSQPDMDGVDPLSASWPACTPGSSVYADDPGLPAELCARVESLGAWVSVVPDEDLPRVDAGRGSVVRVAGSDGAGMVTVTDDQGVPVRTVMTASMDKLDAAVFRACRLSDMKVPPENEWRVARSLQMAGA